MSTHTSMYTYLVTRSYGHTWLVAYMPTDFEIMSSLLAESRVNTIAI